MKKVNYLVIVLLVLFLGFSSVSAKTCYCKKTGNSKKCSYVTKCKAQAKTKKKKKVTCTKVKKKKCSSSSKKNSTNSSSTSKKTSDNKIYNDDYKFSSADGLAYVACGSGVSVSKCDGSGKGAYDIPAVVPSLTSFAVNALKIVTPIILIIVGMIQLLMAVSSSDEDSIKKAQGKLVKKIIISVMVFMVIYIVQFVVDKVADDGERSSVSNCFSCFLNNNCPLYYYRDGDNGNVCKCIKGEKCK